MPKTHRWDIFGGELVGSVGDEQAGFTHGTITDHNTLNRLHSCALSGSTALIQDLPRGRRDRGGGDYNK